MNPGGKRAIDPLERYYLGISQGGIFGGTLAALSQDIDRFALQVGGISYPIMITRSVDFPDYAKILRAWYKVKPEDTVPNAQSTLAELKAKK